MNRSISDNALWIFLVLCNLVYKAWFLGSNSLALDEPFSVYHAQMNIDDIVRLLSSGNNPPLYEIFLHYWIGFFGISEIAVRFPSLIFSTITVYFIYRYCSNYLNLNIAFGAGMIFIFSNYHISFAHEARAYALMGMLTMISMYCYMAILKTWTHQFYKSEEKSRLSRTEIIWIAINVLLIYTHYFGFFVLFIQLLFLFISRQKVRWKKLGIYSLIIFLCYVPNLYILASRVSITVVEGTWLNPPTGADSMYNELRFFCNKPVVATIVIGILVLAFFRFIIWSRKRSYAIAEMLPVFWFCTLFFGMFLLSFKFPMFLGRYLMSAMIALCIVIPLGVGYLVKSLRGYYLHISTGILSLLFIFTSDLNFPNYRPLKAAVDQVNEYMDVDVGLVICPKHFLLNFSYYYDREVFQDYDSVEILSTMERRFQEEHIYAVDNVDDLEGIFSMDKIIYLDAAADFSFPDNGIIDRLNLDYLLEKSHDIPGIYKIYYYVRKG